MSEEKNEKLILPAPEGITDPDQIAGAQERWQECPLNDCKRNPDLLYADFYLRDIRTNRLICSACAVRVEMGYMAREVVRKSDDRFFQGSQMDNGIVLGVMIVASLLSAILSQMLGFFFLIPFMIGSAIGGSAAVMTRRLTERRVTRQTPYIGIAGIVIGAIIAGPLFLLFRTGVFFIDPRVIFNFDVIISSVGMAMGSWGIFMRRI
jgi:hypothetical protein